MALVNDAKKEIHAKIVYYGPGRSGKTTNLEFIYNKLKPEYRGKFKFMNTPSGRMVFFDFMRPELAAIKDFSIHFHIYTVPGESVDASVWKNVLKGVDGIVFVADLEASRTLQNRRSLDNLKEYLEVYGKRLDETPCIFQCNKKDVVDAVSVAEIRNLLDIGDVPVIPASARSGEGVLPALSEMVKMVLQRLRDLPLGHDLEVPAISEEPPLDMAGGQAQARVYPVEQPEALDEEAEPLIVEPVEEDVVYALEQETTPAATPEETEPGFAEVPASVSSPSEFHFEQPLERSPDSAFTPHFRFDAEGSEPLCTEQPFSGGSNEGVTEETELPGAEIELEGDMESLGNGRFRLPLVIRFGGKETRAALNFDVSFGKRTLL